MVASRAVLSTQMEEEKEFCAVCKNEVKCDDEALHCDVCGNWQHLRCGSATTIMSSSDGRVVDEDIGTEVEELEWSCSACHAEGEIIESSVSEQSVSQICSDLSADERTTYNILSGGSQRGGDMLYDNNGYSYTIRSQNANGSRLWRCSVRGKCPCPATIREKDNQFTEGLRSHNHAGLPRASIAAKISVRLKTITRKDPVKAAAQIVQDVMQEQLFSHQPLQALDYLARNANNDRCRRSSLKEPKTIDFDIETENLPTDFLIGDIKIEGARHVIFATRDQLRLLQKAKIWFVDTTFKVVRQPFNQLFSIHAFVCSGEATKQIPLLFCMMSRRRTRDYKAVLTKVLSLLDRTAVKRVVTYFEIATWKAVSKVMPHVELKGCSFHFTQAVFKKIEELGLQKLYCERQTARFAMKQLMSLCYLPGILIEPTFNHLRRKHTDHKLQPLFEYMYTSWILHTTWRPPDWSVYGTAVRTNSDLEGWHNRLNREGRQGMTLHMLAALLYQEATSSKDRVHLLSDGKIRKRRRKEDQQTDGQTYKLWKKFKEGKITTDQMVKGIGRVNGPYQ